MAKGLSQILSGGTAQRMPGLNKYCGNHRFEYTLADGERVRMIVTSVLGHLSEIKFDAAHQPWKACDPIKLFDAPIVQTIPEVGHGKDKTGLIVQCCPELGERGEQLEGAGEKR